MIKTTQRIPGRGERDNRTTEVTGVSIETGKKEEEKPAAKGREVERGHKAAAGGAAGTG